MDNKNFVVLVIAVASMVTSIFTYLDHRQTARAGVKQGEFLNHQFGSNYVADVEGKTP